MEQGEKRREVYLKFQQSLVTTRSRLSWLWLMEWLDEADTLMLMVCPLVASILLARFPS